MQILAGLSYLLEKRLLHLDIAARNTLLGSRNEVKIADFGMCRRLPESKASLVVKEIPKVATRWLAVEAFDEHKLSEKSDVWAVGVTVWEICTQGEKPYSDVHFLQVAREVKDGRRLSQPRSCPDPLWEVVSRCWHKKPEKRPTFAELTALLTQVQKDLDATETTRDLGRHIFTRTMGKPLQKVDEEQFQVDP